MTRVVRQQLGPRTNPVPIQRLPAHQTVQPHEQPLAAVRVELKPMHRSPAPPPLQRPVFHRPAPPPQPAVHRHRHHIPAAAAGQPTRRPHRPAMRQPRPQRFTTFRPPEPDRSIVAPGHHLLPVGGERNPPHRPVVLQERHHWPPRRDVPHPRGVVVARRRETVSVRTEVPIQHQTTMVHGAEIRPPVRGVPDTELESIVGPSHMATVPAQPDPADRETRPGPPEHPTCRNLRHPQRPILIRPHHQRTIPRKARIVHPASTGDQPPAPAVLRSVQGESIGRAEDEVPAIRREPHHPQVRFQRTRLGTRRPRFKEHFPRRHFPQPHPMVPSDTQQSVPLRVEHDTIHRGRMGQHPGLGRGHPRPDPNRAIGTGRRQMNAGLVDGHVPQSRALRRQQLQPRHLRHHHLDPFPVCRFLHPTPTLQGHGRHIMGQRHAMIVRLPRIVPRDHVQPDHLDPPFLRLRRDLLPRGPQPSVGPRNHKPDRQARGHQECCGSCRPGSPPRPSQHPFPRRRGSTQDRLMPQPPFQLVRQRLRRAVPTPRLLLQTLQGDDLQIPRKPRPQQRRPPRWLLQHPPHRLRGRSTGKRRLPRQQFVQDRSQPVDIRPRRHLLCPTRRLFGRHVRRRAQHGARLRDRPLPRHQLRQPEIHQQRFPAFIQQHVRRLEIPMQDAPLMRMMDGARQLPHQRRSTLRREHQPRLSQRLRQRPARHQPHHQIVPTLDLPETVHRDDVRMRQRGGRRCLRPKPFHEGPRGPFPGQQHLQRHFASQPGIQRTVNHPGPATAQLPQQSVRPKIPLTHPHRFCHLRRLPRHRSRPAHQTTRTQSSQC